MSPVLSATVIVAATGPSCRAMALAWLVVIGRMPPLWTGMPTGVRAAVNAMACGRPGIRAPGEDFGVISSNSLAAGRLIWSGRIRTVLGLGRADREDLGRQG